jgi:DNA repair protein RadC
MDEKLKLKINEINKFSSPEEEIEYLRAKVLSQEKRHLENLGTVDRESVIKIQVLTMCLPRDIKCSSNTS